MLKTTIRIVLFGVWAHLVFLTSMNFCFYLEYYGTALAGSVLFFAVNLIGALTSLPGLPALTPGLSYLAAGACAGVCTMVVLFSSARNIDRVILARVSGV